jgi:hypothetical protein
LGCRSTIKKTLKGYHASYMRPMHEPVCNVCRGGSGVCVCVCVCVCLLYLRSCAVKYRYILYRRHSLSRQKSQSRCRQNVTHSKRRKPYYNVRRRSHQQRLLSRLSLVI